MDLRGLCKGEARWSLMTGWEVGGESGVADRFPTVSPSQPISLSYTLHGQNAHVPPTCAVYEEPRLEGRLHASRAGLVCWVSALSKR